MHLIVLVCSMALSALGQVEDDWIDPYDMLNYDATTKTMRKPPEVTCDSSVQEHVHRFVSLLLQPRVTTW